MTDRIGIAEEIIDLFGPGLAERLRTQDAHAARGTCDVCALPTDPDLGAVNLVVQVYAPSNDPVPSYVSIPRHAACGPSEIVAAAGPHPSDTAEATVMAASWPRPGRTEHRPILLVSLPTTAGVWPDTSAFSDPMIDLMTSKGWEQPGTMQRKPTATPDVAIEWRLAPGVDGAGPGRLLIYEPSRPVGDHLIAEVDPWRTSDPWTRAIAAQGWVDVYMGAFGIAVMAPEELSFEHFDRFAANGRAVAAKAPCTVLDHQGRPFPTDPA